MRVLLNISEEDKNIKLYKLNKIMYEIEEDYELLKMNSNNVEYNSNK
jgi:hypothetical protein